MLGRGLPDDRGWETVQAKTFTNWYVTSWPLLAVLFIFVLIQTAVWCGNVKKKCEQKITRINTKLALRGIPPMKSLVLDLADGVHLVQLMEIMSDTKLGKYYCNPTLKVQMAENVNLALNFLRRRGLVLTNTGAEDIIDGNLKIILGLIWKLILRFTVEDISQEGLTARDGLLLWCQRQTSPYKPRVDVQDFKGSWTDGLALCALIHRHRPELLDYGSLPPGDDLASRRERTNLAFSVAEEYLDIPRLMDVADLALPPGGKPDEKSVMTYIAQYYYAFSTRQQAEVATRRLAAFADLLRSVWLMRNDYERRARRLLTMMGQQMHKWSSNATESDDLEGGAPVASISSLPADQQDIPEERRFLVFKGHMDKLKEYKRTTKRDWVREKGELDALLANIQTKLRTYELRPWYPRAGLGTADLRDAWSQLATAEAQAASTAKRSMRYAKDMLDARFARLANSYEDKIMVVRDALSALEPSDDLDAQSAVAQDLIPLLQGEDLAQHKADLVATDAACQRSIITENDGTIYNLDDLEFDQQLTEAAVIKKLAFFDNQVCCLSCGACSEWIEKGACLTRGCELLSCASPSAWHDSTTTRCLRPSWSNSMRRSSTSTEAERTPFLWTSCETAWLQRASSSQRKIWSKFTTS